MKALLCLTVLLASVAVQSQSIIRTGNYQGVNGVFNNPANIADSKHRLDVNLVSISTSIANDRASFRIRDMGKSLNLDSIRNQFLYSHFGTSNALAFMDVAGPSIMISLGKHSSFALTTRARIMANQTNFDGKLLDAIYSDQEPGQTIPYTLNMRDEMRMTMNAWTEYGLSYAHVLYNNGRHFIKGGLTVKYLVGVGSGFTSVNKLTGILHSSQNEGYYLRDASGTVGVGSVGLNFDDIEPQQFEKMESKGLGADLGFVYEYRQDHENYDEGNTGSNENKYKVQVSVSLLDLGKITYRNPHANGGLYNINIGGNEQFYFNQFDGVKLQHANQVFENNPGMFEKIDSDLDRDYQVSLPMITQIGIDYQLYKSIHINLTGTIPFRKDQLSKPFNSRSYASITFTPRIESRKVGLYIPVQYNALSRMNAGVAIRMGGLYLGSSSILSAIFKESKQLDLQLGAKFSLLKK